MEEYRTVLIGAGAAIALIAFIAMIVFIVRRRRRKRALEAPLPLIPFSAGLAATVPPRPDRAVRPVSGFDSDSRPTPPWSPASPLATTAAGASPFAPPPAPTRTPSTTPAGRRGPLAQTAVPDSDTLGEQVDGASVRYWRPADGTLQFLPGRLEVIAGQDSGQEIRFVRTPGPDGTSVTFGRAEGAAYRHVQLREPTVSRLHARMCLEVGGNASGQIVAPRWRLENLSSTNPVVVNGTPLPAESADACQVYLDEGDRIEMGEVVFRFHTK